MKLIIGGIDFISKGYISENGIKQSLEHRSGENAGEMLDGTFRLDYLWTRVRLDISIIDGLTFEEVSEIFKLLSPEGRMEFFTVEYTDVFTGVEVSEQMYSNNYSAEVHRYVDKGTGTIYYKGFTIPLIGGIRE